MCVVVFQIESFGVRLEAGLPCEPIFGNSEEQKGVSRKQVLVSMKEACSWMEFARPYMFQNTSVDCYHRCRMYRPEFMLSVFSLKMPQSMQIARK